jgi:hypothetical protein
MGVLGDGSRTVVIVAEVSMNESRADAPSGLCSSIAAFIAQKRTYSAAKVNSLPRRRNFISRSRNYSNGSYLLTAGGRVDCMLITSIAEPLNIVGENTNPVRDGNAPEGANRHRAIFSNDALCFPHRVSLDSRQRAARLTQPRIIEIRDSLSELAEPQIEALGRLLPALLCGEESSFHVFSREAGRLIEVALYRSLALARRIAVEELEHERLLRHLRNCCPIPDDLANIRLRAHRFFVRMECRDHALHFARVAALDSCVCVILAALAKPLAPARVIVETFKRIRGDEARHVRFSREHSCALGADKSLLADTAACVRSELVDLLYPLASSFEDLGVDAEHLFRRVEADKCVIN